MKNPDELKASEAKIAILEESAENIYSMKFILQSLGYEVHAWVAGKGYLKDLVDFDPAVVLVDMLMPSDTGLILISELRRSPLKDVAIVAVTAEAVPISDDELREAGVNDILTKPYTVADLQESLNRHIKS
ncbi:MAG TPA: response regulator [Acidobacteriota bacterium]|nr:response regulator [Acidobacteriota bacterium]